MIQIPVKYVEQDEKVSVYFRKRQKFIADVFNEYDLRITADNARTLLYVLNNCYETGDYSPSVKIALLDLIVQLEVIKEQ